MLQGLAALTCLSAAHIRQRQGIHPGQVSGSLEATHTLFTLTLTPGGGLESPVNINMHVLGLREETAVPSENTPRHVQNIQTPHRKAVVVQPGTQTQVLCAMK